MGFVDLGTIVAFCITKVTALGGTTPRVAAEIVANRYGRPIPQLPSLMSRDDQHHRHRHHDQRS